MVRDVEVSGRVSLLDVTSPRNQKKSFESPLPKREYMSPSLVLILREERQNLLNRRRFLLEEEKKLDE